MITAIILAAGRSRRMGEPKPLLTLGENETFLSHAIHVLRAGGCDEVIVVVGPQQEDAPRQIAIAARSAGARTIENPTAESEQIDSLQVALRALPQNPRAAVVTPVDLPGLTPQIVAAVIAAFEDGNPPIVVPRYRDGHGHPVLFSRAMFAELCEPDLSEGARTIVHRHQHELREVEVATQAVIDDVNTPTQYRNFINRNK